MSQNNEIFLNDRRRKFNCNKTFIKYAKFTK